MHQQLQNSIVAGLGAVFYGLLGVLLSTGNPLMVLLGLSFIAVGANWARWSAISYTCYKEHKHE